MSWITALAGIVLAVVIPFLVALVRQAGWSGRKKRWVAIAASVLGGVATAIIGGVPTPETLGLYVLAMVGAVQGVYTIFKSFGVTVGWLDALAGVGTDDKNTVG